MQVLKIFTWLMGSLILLSASAIAEDLCITASQAMKTASELRGLSPKRPVPCRSHEKNKIKQYVIKAIKTETPEARIRGEGLLYAALGIIPPDFDYEKELVDLYTSQIGGYYDPKKDQYVMAAWIPASLQYPVSVHELVHALQDQHFDLETFMNIKTMSSDELMARSALVEGDATAVMVDYSLRAAGGGTLFDQQDVSLFIAQNVVGTQLLATASPTGRTLMTLMIFPYSSGLRFAHEVIRTSRSYDTLNTVFLNPPRSTEEILHPEKLGDNKKEFEIPVITVEGLTAIHEDTLGEFFLSVWLNSQGVDGVTAATAAAGWGGDRAAVFQFPDGSHSIRWHIRFDTERDAEEFSAALKIRTGSNGAFECKELLCSGVFSAPLPGVLQ